MLARLSQGYAEDWHRVPGKLQMNAYNDNHQTRQRAFSRSRSTAAAVIALVLALAVADTASAASRIKDIVDIEGVRENQLVGYGLVVGLNNTGDTLREGSFTKQSLQSMLNRLGVKPTNEGLTSKNVAAVMITAELPPFARQGTRIDVTVSSLGDADNLQGGTLLVTPLLGADGEVYAVGQGQVGVAGYSAKGQAESVTQGVPTSGRIANGAIVEREVAFEMANMDSVTLNLRSPDFTTARRVGQAINAFLGTAAAKPRDPSTVHVDVPDSYRRNVVNLITDIEQLRIEPDQPAKVIIDETSGIIVMGENVRVSTVAIAQGNLTIRITETPEVSQPEPFAEVGQTVEVPRTDIAVDDSSAHRLGVVQEGVTLQDLVNGLNALGIGPRDMISILQAIKAAGALHAEIEVM
jgi:flagellar P-ring protein precursor FlgI